MKFNWMFHPVDISVQYESQRARFILQNVYGLNFVKCVRDKSTEDDIFRASYPKTEALQATRLVPEYGFDMKRDE